TRIAPEQSSALQRGIVTSHATAVGRPLSREEARAMLLLRAHVLALGHSGVRAEVIELMVEMLNRDVVPAVPEQGSLGASGDLAPLAGLALPLIGLGRLLTSGGATEAAADGLDRAGLHPLEPQAKEGLALVNRAPGMLSRCRWCRWRPSAIGVSTGSSTRRPPTASRRSWSPRAASTAGSC